MPPISYSKDGSQEAAEYTSIHYEDFLKSWDLFDGQNNFSCVDKSTTVNKSSQRTHQKKPESNKRKYTPSYETELEELKLHQKTVDSDNEAKYQQDQGDELLLSLEDLL